jgi:hypothetical protein
MHSYVYSIANLRANGKESALYMPIESLNLNANCDLASLEVRLFQELYLSPKRQKAALGIKPI